jgi:hypothetical protein
MNHNFLAEFLWRAEGLACLHRYEAAVIPGGVAVNAGGSAAGWFGADAGSSGGTASSTTSAIDMSGLISPAPQAVYQSSRYRSSSYTISNLTPP